MIYIIILVWNGKKYLSKLFEGLDVLSYPKEKYKILVLDSASTDGSLEFLERLEKEGKIELMKLQKNFGFCGGNNVGMEMALKNSAKYVVLLNQDTFVEPDFLNELVKAAGSEEKIGVVQALLLYNDGKTINSLGNQNHILGYGWCEGNYQQLTTCNSQLTTQKEITYASGAAVLYKAEMLKKIGLFDENYFSYNEDADICHRARMVGYKTVLASKAIVYHDYHFPTDKNKKRYFWMEKNRLYMVWKFYKLKTLLFLSPLFLAMCLGQLLNAIKKGYWKGFFGARLWFIPNFFKVRKARIEVQKTRQISDREFMKNFAAEIKYQPVSNFLLDKIGNPMMRVYWKLIKKII
jgi:hypothetical protein